MGAGTSTLTTTNFQARARRSNSRLSHREPCTPTIHSLSGLFCTCDRLLLTTALAPHQPSCGYEYLLFGARTLRCIACVLAAAAALTGDRRALRVAHPASDTLCLWALQRPLSAASLAHRCSLVALGTHTTAGGHQSGGSGRQPLQQRVARCRPARARVPCIVSRPHCKRMVSVCGVT